MDRRSPLERFRSAKLKLDYPCPWTYTVFGEGEERLRAAVERIVGPLEHTLNRSHTSRTGRYLSMHVEVIVENDRQRLGIFRALHEHPHVRYVL